MWARLSVAAIHYENDVPENWAPYRTANAAFFEELGSPGGASEKGKIPHDVGPQASLASQHQDA